MQLYVSNVRPLNQFLEDYHFQVRISTSLTASLLDMVGTPAKPVTDLELNVSNIIFNLVKPRGILNVSVDLLIENIELRFKQEVEENKKLCMNIATIDTFLSSTNDL